jgi:hypothetical protein
VTFTTGNTPSAPLWPALAWSAWLTAYRADAPLGSRLPAVQVRFAAPGFRRWGETSRRFAAPGEIDFPAAAQPKPLGVPENAVPESEAHR